MANQNLTLPVALRGGGAPVVVQLAFPANAWQHVQLQINSTVWNVVDGLFLGYSARVSIDAGVTWVAWGGFTAVSPTFMKDGVTKVEPGGIWDWDPTFAVGGLIELTVDVPVAFLWGATASLFDT